MRINNLEFRQASYIGEPPKNPNWEICLWQPNQYYGKEDMFIEQDDYYYYPDDKYNFVKIHKSCFQNPETAFTIGTFRYDSEGFYEFHFCGDRPIRYKHKFDLEDFWRLIEYGDDILNVDEESL